MAAEATTLPNVLALHNIAATKRTYINLTNSEGWNEKPAISTEICAPHVVFPSTSVMPSIRIPITANRYFIFTMVCLFLMKRGTKKPMTVPIRTITNCLKALDGASLSTMTNPSIISIDILLTICIEQSG